MYRRGRIVFFASRRRHTRYWRDWSSDVCSSDLDRALERLAFLQGLLGELAFRDVDMGSDPFADLAVVLEDRRSEERRVGKECRSRRSPYHSKNIDIVDWHAVQAIITTDQEHH